MAFSVVALGPADAASRRNQVVQCLVEGFMEDATCTWICPDNEERKAGFLPQFMAGWVDAALTVDGCCYVHEDEEDKRAGRVSAVAVWIPPKGHPHLHYEEPKASYNGRVDEMFHALDRETPDEPHWHLMLICASPPGGGRGGRILAPGLERARREGYPVILESSSRRNLMFYARNGFGLLNEVCFGVPRCSMFLCRQPCGSEGAAALQAIAADVPADLAVTRARLEANCKQPGEEGDASGACEVLCRA